MKVPLASSGLRTEDIEIAIAVLQSGNLTMGSQVKAFEKDMSNYLGTKHFIMMNSGSSANLAIFEALLRPSITQSYLQKDAGVLVPAVAWPTTIWPIVQLGLHPVFVDVDLQTLGMDLQSAQDVIDKSDLKIKAIFPIHPLGYTLDSKELLEFCDKNDLILLNDVCESLGSWQNGIHGGIAGLASSFSFYFSHHITTMEGGGVATNNDDLANDLRSIRSHGWSRDRFDASNWTNEISSTDSKFRFVTTGFNIRPMEIQASIGRSQIRDINKFVNQRRSIARRVHQALIRETIKVVDANCFTHKDSEEIHSWMLIPISVMGANRIERKKKILEYLESQGVETRPVLTGNFLAQPAMERIDSHHQPAVDFPNATEVADSYFMVGAHHDLSEDQIVYLIQTLLSACKKFR
jgi:CDP-6-deoxy-D-xylo-4-hexulose-3-dehydrase